jgi:hypothetical protein
VLDSLMQGQRPTSTAGEGGGTLLAGGSCEGKTQEGENNTPIHTTPLQPQTSELERERGEVLTHERR